MHELHIWRLNERKAIASAHIVVANEPLSNSMRLAKTINECFHAYGIHSATLQPELALSGNIQSSDSPIIGGVGNEVGGVR